MIAPGDNPGFGVRLFAGGFAGSVSIAIMNPTEIIKTQMQAHRGTGLTMGGVLSTVYKAEGIAGLWAGLQPNILRCFLVNAAELGTCVGARPSACPPLTRDSFLIRYDQAKHWLIERDLFTAWPVVQHVSASGVAGLASALTSTPADVVKTRLMNQAGHAHQYTGMGNAFVTILRTEGLAALYKGFSPILVRKLMWCTTFFVGYEQILARLN